MGGRPLNYARERGIDDVVATLERLAKDFGERFRPHPGWQSFGEGEERAAGNPT